MKIIGSFLAKNQHGKIISSGENLIVNNGKKIICDWLIGKQLNYNYNDDDQTTQVYRGVDLSNERFLNSEQYNVYSDYIAAGFQQFWSTNSISYMPNQSVIYFQVNGQPIKLSGLFFNLFSTTSIYSDISNHCRYQYKIYTSPYEYSYSQVNNLWTMCKLSSNSIASNINTNNKHNFQKVVRFDSANSVDYYIQNVKSIKIVFLNCYNYNDYYKLPLHGIGLLKKNNSPNVPCVIGLSNSSHQPNVIDTKLHGQNVYKFFVNSQKAYFENQDGKKRNVQLKKFYSQDQMNRFFSQGGNSSVKSINIVYRIRLNYQQCNGIDINQIGLFFSNRRVDYTATAQTCAQLFSYGKFENVWRKSSDQIIDIQYTISLSA